MSKTSEKTRADLSSRLKPPSMVKVIMHNDHYTSMDFVVTVLMDIFHKADSEANQIMMAIHKAGLSIVGIYTHDIARTKVDQTHKAARKAGFPLRCTMENEQ